MLGFNTGQISLLTKLLCIAWRKIQSMLTESGHLFLSSRSPSKEIVTINHYKVHLRFSLTGSVGPCRDKIQTFTCQGVRLCSAASTDQNTPVYCICPTVYILVLLVQRVPRWALSRWKGSSLVGVGEVG